MNINDLIYITDNEYLLKCTPFAINHPNLHNIQKLPKPDFVFNISNCQHNTGEYLVTKRKKRVKLTYCFRTFPSAAGRSSCSSEAAAAVGRLPALGAAKVRSASPLKSPCLQQGVQCGSTPSSLSAPCDSSQGRCPSSPPHGW